VAEAGVPELALVLPVVAAVVKVAVVETEAAAMQPRLNRLRVCPMEP
jgi:hypothetical protein